jgi:multiple sugar transport system permease protein/cellobiose transport system permease protein
MAGMNKSLKKILFMLPLALTSLLSAFPFYFIISMATHSTSEIYKGNVFMLGTDLIKNLTTIMKGGFAIYYWNSMYTSVLSGLLSIAISSMAAYSLSIYDFKGKRFATSFIIASMMIPAQISLIGYTIEMKHLGLVNTHMPLILTWAASAYGVFFMLQYMKSSVPKELVESARIDGSSEFRTYLMIVMPLIKPAVGTLMMLIFLWSWNNFMMPSTMLTQNDKFTIPLGIQSLSTAYTQDWGARGAALAIAVMPMIIIFSFGSKYFVQGISAGAVKG